MLDQSGVFQQFQRNAGLTDQPVTSADSFYLIYSQRQFDINVDPSPSGLERDDDEADSDIMAMLPSRPAPFAYEPFVVMGKQGPYLIPVTNITFQQPRLDPRTDCFWGPYTIDEVGHFDPLPVDLVHDARIRNCDEATRFARRWSNLLRPA